MKKVNFYFDGFNFYYGLRSKKWRKYYWLDIIKFCESFLLQDQELNKVYYCTAVQTNLGKKKRQDDFFRANRLNLKFELIFGKYINKTLHIKGQTIHTFEEKQTDVNIAVEMIKGVITKSNDITVLVSADSDLVPPIKLIKEIDPLHQIHVYFPPERNSADLRQLSDRVVKLSNYEQRFKKSLLPDSITLPNNYVLKRPKKWK